MLLPIIDSVIQLVADRSQSTSATSRQKSVYNTLVITSTNELQNNSYSICHEPLRLIITKVLTLNIGLSSLPSVTS